MQEPILEQEKTGWLRSIPAKQETKTAVKTDRNEKRITKEIRELLIDLKKQIDDDYRASDDPSDNTPGMQVTVSTDDLLSWNYQTGDNSYSGSCYGDRHWAVIYLYRTSNCTVLAQEAIEELGEGIACDEHEAN